ncbi:myosin regulatory light chain 2-like [Panulirus ornatus]|uniref:myosin regulatory light chain 2-like n=1 Tax=Panulirus ornatus TaxID=150431 RepID=UPI003A88C3E9
MPASKGSRSSSKKAKKGGSNVFDMFTQKQVAEFKEGFQVMDRDRDGVISKEDLRGVYDEIGRLITDKDLDDMLADAPGPINFTTLLHMFAERSSGESDDDDVVAASFRAFEKEPGQIDSEQFRTMLMAFGDKFTSAEVDDAFEQMDLDEDTGIIDADALIGMLCAGSGKEGEGEEATA